MEELTPAARTAEAARRGRVWAGEYLLGHPVDALETSWPLEKFDALGRVSNLSAGGFEEGLLIHVCHRAAELRWEELRTCRRRGLPTVYPVLTRIRRGDYRHIDPRQFVDPHYHEREYLEEMVAAGEAVFERDTAGELCFYSPVGRRPRKGGALARIAVHVCRFQLETPCDCKETVEVPWPPPPTYCLMPHQADRMLLRMWKCEAPVRPESTTRCVERQDFAGPGSKRFYVYVERPTLIQWEIGEGHAPARAYAVLVQTGNYGEVYCSSSTCAHRAGYAASLRVAGRRQMMKRAGLLHAMPDGSEYFDDMDGRLKGYLDQGKEMFRGLRIYPDKDPVCWRAHDGSFLHEKCAVPVSRLPQRNDE